MYPLHIRCVPPSLGAAVPVQMWAQFGSCRSVPGGCVPSNPAQIYIRPSTEGASPRADRRVLQSVGRTESLSGFLPDSAGQRRWAPANPAADVGPGCRAGGRGLGNVGLRSQNFGSRRHCRWGWVSLRDSAPGLGSPLPHLRWDCSPLLRSTGTGQPAMEQMTHTSHATRSTYHGSETNTFGNVQLSAC